MQKMGQKPVLRRVQVLHHPFQDIFPGSKIFIVPFDDTS